MNINTCRNNDELTIAVSGHLDSDTCSDLEDIIKKELPATNKLILDFSDLNYISSNGIRILLATEKKLLSTNGTMEIHNVTDSVLEIFQLVGMTNVLTIINR